LRRALRGNQQNSTFFQAQIDEGEALPIDFEPNYPVKDRNGEAWYRLRTLRRSFPDQQSRPTFVCRCDIFIKPLVLQSSTPDLPFEHRLRQFLPTSMWVLRSHLFGNG
jgi:hypothetical protein